VRVKICGITRAEDATLACELGASAVGFVFWARSPRAIPPDIARQIVMCLPASVVPVGVFVDEDPDIVRRTASHVALGAIQLHGSESAEYASQFMEPVIKAVPVDERFDPASLDALPPSVTVLLDVSDPVRKGGTGKTIDWSAARAAASRRPVLLAGGLTPANVAEAISIVSPYGIDVSSGVEASPGIKDRDKLRALFAAVPNVTPPAETKR
jgi:phosphoribosylanthranilate isomerase